MIVVTVATGHLGRLVVERLLELDVPAERIAAAAFAGADRLLLVSSPGGDRVAQHRNAVEAAASAGVGLLAYTSILNVTASGIALAADHKAAEELIAGSGLPYVFLRNGWYLENYTGSLAAALQTGAVVGSAGDGEISGAARADYAAAAATVLTSGVPAITVVLRGASRGADSAE